MTELPLYGIHELDAVPITEPVIVVEGEPARDRDALQAHGFFAHGTVTEAATCPNDAAFAPLAEPIEVNGIARRRRVILWPDHDEPGRKHMTKIGAALTRLGIGSVELTWGERDGDDAADFFQRGGTAEQLQAMIAANDIMAKLIGSGPVIHVGP